MGRTNEYQTETSPFDGSQKDAKMAPEKKIFCDIPIKHKQQYCGLHLCPKCRINPKTSRQLEFLLVVEI